MLIYLLLLEDGECYGYNNSIRDACINYHSQSIVYSVTNKQHVYSPLECTILIYISMCTYCTYNYYLHISIKMHIDIYSVLFTEARYTTDTQNTSVALCLLSILTRKKKTPYAEDSEYSFN